MLAFLAVSAVVICVPGPDTALTIRNALAGGRCGGVATAAGVALGQAVWTLATGVGIAELLQASEPAFLVLKWAGAGVPVAGGRFGADMRVESAGDGPVTILLDSSRGF